MTRGTAYPTARHPRRPPSPRSPATPSAIRAIGAPHLAEGAAGGAVVPVGGRRLGVECKHVGAVVAQLASPVSRSGAAFHNRAEPLERGQRLTRGDGMRDAPTDRLHQQLQAVAHPLRDPAAMAVRRHHRATERLAVICGRAESRRGLRLRRGGLRRGDCVA
eukprot:scaffold33789_cov101-Isochrysis_galbana.AAC.4